MHMNHLLCEIDSNSPNAHYSSYFHHNEPNTLQFCSLPLALRKKEVKYKIVSVLNSSFLNSTSYKGKENMGKYDIV